jgi:hypothetical protein
MHGKTMKKVLTDIRYYSEIYILKQRVILDKAKQYANKSM